MIYQWLFHSAASHTQVAVDKSSKKISPIKYLSEKSEAKGNSYYVSSNKIHFDEIQLEIKTLFTIHKVSSVKPLRLPRDDS